MRIGVPNVDGSFTVLIIGHLPKAPGTFASLFALFVIVILRGQPALFLTALIILTLVGVWSSERISKKLGDQDPGLVVIDEVCGMLMSFLFIPISWTSVAIGFILFRVFDIVKPPPLRLVDEKIRGGLGIVLDDVLAGIYANIALRLLMNYVG